MAKKQQYRLSVLLELREQAKQEAERFLGECLAALKTEEDRLAQMEDELARMVSRRETRMREYAEKQMRGDMSAQAMISANSFIERLKEQEEPQEKAIESQKEVILQREEEVTEARSKLITANQELKALEKHREKWEEKVKRERAIKEEEALDELAQTIFLNKERE